MILYIILAIVLTIAIVWLIDKFVPNKLRPVVHIVLWAVIIALGYFTYMSVYEEIKFNEIKEERYAKAIEKLIDIRDSELAYKEVNGKFTKSYDSLIKFIETGKFTLTQRRDSSIVDEELTKRYGGVTTYKEIVLVDTLGYASVKDSLFKSSNRYKTMMNVPFAKEGTKFKLDAGYLTTSDTKIPVFEASVKKRKILHDQPNDLILKENQVISVEGVNGDAIKVGSMDEVKTIGNWPKTYGSNE
ncbi:hypothetical protein [Aurantibacter aestuarii]|uniref:Uncharacterized protein n=1 Tax=Aurantibacter aestuarii TaxID=1266046 RepID=A0A2T1N4Y3_9FLAO|nr:hypothetical protein [Aurantibacter aestuarii]PSG86341.1 hypothetical protein C7H52_11650 [Aurantibacter aestuarii]